MDARNFCFEDELTDDAIEQIDACWKCPACDIYLHGEEKTCYLCGAARNDETLGHSSPIEGK